MVNLFYFVSKIEAIHSLLLVFATSCFNELRIHFRKLVIFTADSSLQVLLGRLYPL